ncbi:MAG TPA: PEP-CTERM sorting domain-containing protein [Fimbriimonadaceae bacterium]|nr:PEP-CTERM sorting domain-containing protein [Fimbriimonadaceae bacterium]
MFVKGKGLLALAAIALIGSGAHAQVVASSGVTATVPTDVRPGAQEDNSTAWLMIESALAPGAAFTVDTATTGLFDEPSDLAAPASVTSSAPVQSFLLWSDRLGATGSTAYVGYLEFANPIVGVAVRSATLDLTDVFGAPGVTYPGGVVGRGSELSPTVESFQISADRKRLDFQFRTFNVVDEIRIFATVPEPVSAFVLLVGLGAVVARRFRRS